MFIHLYANEVNQQIASIKYRKRNENRQNLTLQPDNSRG